LKIWFGIILASFLVVTFSLLSTLIASASAQQATGTATILGTCGLSFPNGNAVNYGSLLPNATSSEKILNMTNSGSVNATLTVTGGDWLNSGGIPVMNRTNTHYNITSGTFFQKTPLQNFDQLVTGNFTSGVILQTFWQLQAILLNPFTGSATQTMNFTVSC